MRGRSNHVDRASELHERAELAARGIGTDTAEELLSVRYRCAWPGCTAASLFPDGLRVVPDVRDGVAVCPLCGHELQPAGLRAPCVEVKVARDGVELTRLVVESGDPLVLGRRGGVGAVALDELLTSDLVTAVSRRHLRLTVDQRRQLVAEDLGSSNGTAVVRAAGGGEALTAGQPTVIDDGDVIVLPGRLWLAKSSRRYTLATRPPVDESPDANPTMLL